GQILAGPIYQDAHVQITAVPVHHGTWPYAFAYRVVTTDRTILVTGDYAPPVDAIIAACNGCDVLVSEGYPSHLADGPRAGYMHSFHTSAVELGELATRAHAKSIVVTHRRSHTDDVVLAEIRRNYAGPVLLANDLDRI
ncbi:MAG: MBL fold metallo-hydrolase, partial [Kofleriaceae bacterium]